MNNIVYILGATAIGVGGLLAYKYKNKPALTKKPNMIQIVAKGYWKGAGRGKVWVPAAYFGLGRSRRGRRKWAKSQKRVWSKSQKKVMKNSAWRDSPEVQAAKAKFRLIKRSILAGERKYTAVDLQKAINHYDEVKAKTRGTEKVNRVSSPIFAPPVKGVESGLPEVQAAKAKYEFIKNAILTGKGNYNAVDLQKAVNYYLSVKAKAQEVVNALSGIRYV